MHRGQRAATWAEFDRLIPSRSVMFGIRDGQIRKVPSHPIDDRIIQLARHGNSVEAITLELHQLSLLYAVPGSSIAVT